MTPQPRQHEAHQHEPHDGHEHGHQHGHQYGAGVDHDALAEMLDLDAEVLREPIGDLLGWLEGLTGDASPRRIIDLGSGTGAGTLALLQRFGQADAVAVDSSEQMLRHLLGRARELGLADRIRTVQADLDQGWPEVGTADLAWASASLHHLADPDRTLGQVHDALRPGGLLLVLELDSFPRFLPDDLGFGRPGLEARCQAEIDRRRAADLPHMGSDWGARLSRAGFTVEAERTLSVDLKPPLPAPARRYAEVTLRRLRPALDGSLVAEDLAALDLLLDDDAPESVLRREDLTVRAERTVWAARRAS